MRTLVRALVTLALAGAAACALMQSTAGRPGGRRFYLTKESYRGNQVLGACARGYHTASRFEIWDTSALSYDSTVGLTTDDSGSGPPSEAASMAPPGPAGWVRTGGGSAIADSTGPSSGSAFANCAAWSTSSSQAFGTVAYLTDRFAGSNDVWDGGSRGCDTAHHVWCVEDADRDAGSLLPHPHRQRPAPEP